MLLSTEGDPGPVTMNRFGNPGVATPRYARGPARPDVHQLHVRPVEHRVVLVALAQPLRSDRVRPRAEQLRDRRVGDGLPDPVSHELGDDLVGLPRHQHVGVRAEERHPAARLPALGECPLHVLARLGQHRAPGPGDRNAEERLPRFLPVLPVA
jgi:hypothetical protein